MCIGAYMRGAILLSSLMFLVVFTPIVTAADGDGDGIDDSLDICPYAAGTANSTAGNGCPDSDGDGMADFEQAVVHDWGESEWEHLDYGTIGGSVDALEWAQNNTMFYAGGSGGGGWGGGSSNASVHTFNSLGDHIGTFYVMPGGVNVLDLSPDGQMLAVTSDEGGAVILNATTGALITDLYADSFQIGNSSENVISLSWSNDGDRIFLSTGEFKISSIWTSNWTVEWNYTSLPSWVGAIDTTPDDRLLIFSSGSMVLAYWVNNFTEAWNMSNHSQYIRTVTVSPDGRYVVSGSDANFIVVTEIATNTKITEIDVGSDAIGGTFSPDGGTYFVGNRRNTNLRTYETQTWSSSGTIGGFGSSNNNRGIHSISIDGDGERLVVGWRRGFMSVHIAADGHIRVHGEFSSQLMETSWRTWFPTTDESVRVWGDFDRTTTTLDICDGERYMGSHSNGVSPQYATKSANFNQTGLWDCKNTDGQILEVPYGRMPGAFSVKAGGATEACMQVTGGLSMGQLRWITSSLNRNTLQVDSEMPGLDLASIAPNDDNDNTPEWSDLDSSCADEQIVLAHRWENRTEMWIIKEKLLCANCVSVDSIYPSSGYRYRAVVEDGERQNVVDGLTGPSGEGSIGFTELGFTIDNANGIYIVPLVDNYTHGASDAIAAGQQAINATRNNSRDGIWPMQTDARMFMSIDSLSHNINFARFLLTDSAATQWEDMGFTKLGPWDSYQSWLLLGVDMSHILPDADQDGVWDGDDLCPDTVGVDVDLNGCAENQLDDDMDGYTNDLDDCDNVSGTSIFGTVGCPDSDSDGWSDDYDSHPDDVTEWNDTDLDGYGDNLDDCVDESGNSTIDRRGCIDTDGDGWSDANDQFPSDPSEWVDTDGDSYGDNQDAFPNEVSQWSDEDGDGYGDNSSGLESDNCPSENGTSFENGIFGCIDSDMDGWADIDDDLPFDPYQHLDFDGDGVGDQLVQGSFDICTETPADEITQINSDGCGPSERDSDYDSLNDDVDLCPNTPIMQTANVNSQGCSPQEIDADGDGVFSDVDVFDDNPNQSFDTDGDGFGDDSNAEGGDDCTTQAGNSTMDRVGCLDSDGDGWSDDFDIFDNDPTQWNDTDSDGFGDNWDDESWNESREYGQFVIGATQPDRCPNQASQFGYSEYQGCLNKLNDDNDVKEDNTQSASDEGMNPLTIIGIISAGIIFILIGAVVTLLKKKKPKSRRTRPKLQPKAFADEPIMEMPHNLEQSSEVLNFVATWEELPPGNWLDTDENGTNWYLDDDGKHWYSDSDGYRVWQE